MTASSGFFAVGRKTFIQACDLGINPAAAFLAMACGTGRDQSTTKWSATAIASNVGVRWSAANDAINALLKSALVTKKPGGKRTQPSYKLKTDDDLIWLPRTLIEGASGETPPVMKLRQTQDVMTLRLFIEMYSAQNLVEDGGISTKVIFQKYERREAGKRGAYVVWDFTDASSWVTWGDITKPHQRANLTPDEVKNGISPGADFFPRLKRIESLGLIDWTPYLFESETGEPIHAMAKNGLPTEKALYSAAVIAAEHMLTPGQLDHSMDTGGILAPVLAHIGQVQMIGVARLRYRPQTSLTAAWWATHNDACRELAESYGELSKPKTAQDGNAKRVKTANAGADEVCPF